MSCGIVIGMDLSRKKANFSCLNMKTGETKAQTVTMNREALSKRFGRDGKKNCESALFVIEASGDSCWVAEHLQSLGHEVHVVDARQLKVITESFSKTDSVDAERLMEIAEQIAMKTALGRRLSKVRIRPRQERADKALLTARAVLVKSRAGIVNCVRGLMAVEGVHLRKVATRTFAKTVRESIPQDFKPAVDVLLDQVEQISAKIKSIENKLRSVAKMRYPEIAKLQEIPGVGPVVSAAFRLTISDPSRFKRTRSAGCYLGLTPGRRQSGNVDPHMGITKQGNPMLRSLMVIAAQSILGRFGKDSHLRRCGLRIYEANGKSKIARKRAVVAVARRLGVLMTAILKSGKRFDPKRNMDDPSLSTSASSTTTDAAVA